MSIKEMLKDIENRSKKEAYIEIIKDLRSVDVYNVSPGHQIINLIEKYKRKRDKIE